MRTVACTFHSRFSCSVRECLRSALPFWLVFGVLCFFLDNTNKLLTVVVVSVTESVWYSVTGYIAYRTRKVLPCIFLPCTQTDALPDEIFAEL